MSPVTFTTVRNMSKGLSIPKMSAKPSIGIPTESSTIISMTMEPPGMPGVPIDEMVAVAKMSNIWPKVKSKPKTCAKNTAATA